MTTQIIAKQFTAARRCSVPIVGINTPDPAETIQAVADLCREMDAKLIESGDIESPAAVIAWDFVRGFIGINKPGEAYVASLGDFDESINNPLGAFVLANKLPARSVLLIHQAHRWLPQPGISQAVWNLRDKFKNSERTLVLLGKSIPLPAEITDDVVMLDEPLPDQVRLEQIVRRMHHEAGLECNPIKVVQATEAVRGLSAFGAEQVTAMSLSKKGMDVDSLWERKRQLIEQTPGLKVYRGGDSFEEIGGVPIVKDFVKKIMKGRSRPNAVVFVDEIEKMLGGTGDLSGITQDQLGCLLSYMQDHAAAGMIFIGPPGAAKSAIAKAAGSEGGVPTIQLDLGAAKGSLVGQSEQQLREGLKVITAVSNSKSLWIATCNKIADLPPELRRRFTLGTFFFDLPDAEERRSIWDIYERKYETEHREEALVNDEGWTGAEIRQCCEIAWRLNCSLDEAAEFIVPVSRSAADSIRRLREQAHGRFLSASYPGVYRDQSSQADQPASERKVRL